MHVYTSTSGALERKVSIPFSSNLFWYYLGRHMSIYEPFYEKTYNLDWRHNLLKQRNKFVGTIPNL